MQGAEFRNQNARENKLPEIAEMKETGDVDIVGTS